MKRLSKMISVSRVSLRSSNNALSAGGSAGGKTLEHHPGCHPAHIPSPGAEGLCWVRFRAVASAKR